MEQSEINLTIAALLHDIGKVVYRAGDSSERHPISGAKYLSEKAGISDKDIINPVKYHHARDLKNAKIEDNDNSYLVYMADNISSAIDRREKDGDEAGFDPTLPLSPVFNVMNGNHGKKYYSPLTNIQDEVNFPLDEKKEFNRSSYSAILNDITTNLKGIKTSDSYINSLLEVLEARLSFVPSSTNKGELCDVSLFDHSKLTAAFAICLKYYLDNKKENYKERLFNQGDLSIYSEKCFILSSLDVSGIQSFIYTITSENALKTLRARSFYLDIMMEHLVDELLSREGLSRANLMYCGGGHAYIILPNTESAQKVFDEFLKELNTWFIDEYKNALFIAGAYEPCSAYSLQNNPVGAYSAIYRAISRNMARQKSHRYTADEIRKLNSDTDDDHTRECKCCKHLGRINDEGLCPTCEALKNLSGDILRTSINTAFFAVEDKRMNNLLQLPFNSTVKAVYGESELRKTIEKDLNFKRAYGVNAMYTGENIATKLWVGNYTTFDTFEELAKKSTGGYKKIGILRADVDNLGQAFVSGFADKANNDRYVTISRTSTFSRQLSLFFKHYINDILAHPEFTITGAVKTQRNVAIVYSGGDDIFLAGAWNDIIEAAVDLRNALKKYTENTLTISAGIGVYDPNYPVASLAKEVEALEDKSKDLPGKDAITLFEDDKDHLEDEKKIGDGTMQWDEFIENVLGEKYAVLDSYFSYTEDHGNAFLYKLLDLIRHQDERINFARYVYLLSRMEPGASAKTEEKEAYMEFSNKMYRFINNEKDRRELKMAINIYVYLHREVD